jgi:uncharacterized 2Fe-2S/4Fe-4S cluster protein (DUF4445 family)
MSTAALETFIKKYQTARNYNSKEIRLTMQDAEELSTAISLMLASTNTLSAKVIQLQEQLLADRTEIEMTGGSFT